MDELLQRVGGMSVRRFGMKLNNFREGAFMPRGDQKIRRNRTSRRKCSKWVGTVLLVSTFWLRRRVVVSDLWFTPHATQQSWASLQLSLLSMPSSRRCSSAVDARWDFKAARACLPLAQRRGPALAPSSIKLRGPTGSTTPERFWVRLTCPSCRSILIPAASPMVSSGGRTPLGLLPLCFAYKRPQAHPELFSRSRDLGCWFRPHDTCGHLSQSSNSSDFTSREHLSILI